MKKQVADWLRGPLHPSKPITLQKQLEPQQVNRPRVLQTKSSSQSSEMLLSEATILQIFERPDVCGRLLILGEPGSGKTAALVELAQVLLERAESDVGFPIPVLFSLSSWQGSQQDLTDWLSLQLQINYSVQVDDAKEWPKNRRILPLLDGLDELKSECQVECVAAINHLLVDSKYRPEFAVVCSRQKEYKEHHRRLCLNNSIVLKKLTDMQIQGHLLEINQSQLWEIIEQDSELLELIRTPLFLSMLKNISNHKAALVQDRKILTTPEALSEYIFHTYWEVMMDESQSLVSSAEEQQGLKSKSYKKREPPSKKRVEKWLVFLAAQLERESHTEFLIEEMQFSWLQAKSYQILIYSLSMDAIRSFIGVLFWLFLWLFGVEVNWGVAIWSLPIANEAIHKYAVFKGFNIEPSEKFRFDFTLEFFKKILVRLMQGMVFGMGFGLIISSLFDDSESGLIVGVMLGLIVGLIDGLKDNVDKKVLPNEGIIKSAQNSLLFLVIALPIATFALKILCNSLNQASPTNIENTFVFYLALSCLLQLGFSTSGGLACINHFCLRLSLYFSGSVPWNYACFLDYATELMFLQRIGGRYRFVHKQLQEYFADVREKPSINTRMVGNFRSLLQELQANRDRGNADRD